MTHPDLPDHERPAERGPLVRLEPYEASWPDDDPDANFRADVAAYSLADPLTTLEGVSANLDIPVGVLARYVLARWASGGADALLELGPSTVERMHEAVASAEAVGTDEARLAAYDQLSSMVAWLNAGDA